MENRVALAPVAWAAKGRVATVLLSNEPGGLMDTASLIALSHVLDEVAEAVSAGRVRAALLRSTVAGAFVRHHDVREIATAADNPDTDPTALVHSVYRKLATLAVPTVAEIDGACMGGGLELALCCTLRYVSPNSGPFGFPEISIGIIPGAGGTQRTATAIGADRARELMLTGRLFGADEALRLGLVHVVAEDVVAHAMKVAVKLSTRVPEAVAAISRLVTAREDAELDRGLSDERRKFAALLRSPTTRELLAALAASPDPIVR